MRRIAHLSDVHLLDAHAGTRQARYRFAARFVSLGRRMDPLIRSRRLARALAIAKEEGADHIVISGDLTEVGEQAEFEHFAEVLHDANLSGDAVTLVPGNHDAYAAADSWKRALAGPLARFAGASAGIAGKVVDRGSVAFLPIDTSYFQTMARSDGMFTRVMADALDRRASDPDLSKKALVLVAHHPPFHTHRIMRWIDGLRGSAEVLELLARHPRLQLLHGHLHRMIDRILAITPTATTRGPITTKAFPSDGRNASAPQLFGAPAICDGPDKAPGLRLYDVVDGGLVSVAAVRGTAA